MAPGSVFLAVAAALGGSGVVLGAFGAHALKDRLGAAGQDTWETAVTYHLVHALALLAVGIWMRTGASGTALSAAGWSFFLGVLLFSGSLYVLALGGPRVFGPITPLGGVAFIVGWIALLLAAFGAGATQ